MNARVPVPPRPALPPGPALLVSGEILGSGPGGPLPAPSPWGNFGTFLSYPYGVVIGAPAGGSQGNGALNVQSLYVNGIPFMPSNVVLDAGTF